MCLRSGSRWWLTDSSCTSESTSAIVRRSNLHSIRCRQSVRFGALVEPHRRELRVHCYRMLGSYSDAEEHTQDTFLRAWRARRQFEGRSSLRAWLYRIATNLCVDTLRRRPERRSSPRRSGPAQRPGLAATLPGRCPRHRRRPRARSRSRRCRRQRFRAFSLDVLHIDNGQLVDITTFFVPEMFAHFGLPLHL